jgi:hypothetical protein
MGASRPDSSALLSLFSGKGEREGLGEINCSVKSQSEWLILALSFGQEKNLLFSSEAAAALIPSVVFPLQLKWPVF